LELAENRHPRAVVVVGVDRLDVVTPSFAAGTGVMARDRGWVADAQSAPEVKNSDATV